MRTPARHADVLPHCSAVITHGNHGTVMKALIVGVPLIVVPLGRDQPDNAARVVHAGAGTRLRKNATASALQAAASQVIEDPATAPPHGSGTAGSGTCWRTITRKSAGCLPGSGASRWTARAMASSPSSTGRLRPFVVPARSVTASGSWASRSGPPCTPVRVERRGRVITGLAVHVRPRVAALAQAGEVLVTSTVQMLVLRSGIGFADRGSHTLKGVPGRWQLFALEHT
jgi:EryCIII-like glycosyltransferase